MVDFHDREPTDVALKRARGYALIDPSQVYAPSLFVRQSLEDDNGNVVLWYMNWGYPQLCIDEKMVAEADYARDALILTQKINLDGWVFCLSPLLGFNDARREKVEKKVMVRQSAFFTMNLSLTVLTGRRWDNCGQGGRRNDRYCPGPGNRRTTRPILTEPQDSSRIIFLA